MFVSMLGVIIERDIFSLPVELEVGSVRETLGEGGLAVKSMRKLLCCQHGLRVNAGGVRESRIERQGRRTRFAARQVG